MATERWKTRWARGAGQERGDKEVGGTRGATRTATRSRPYDVPVRGKGKVSEYGYICGLGEVIFVNDEVLYL